MQGETWVVTGASGFVGGKLAHTLTEELLASDNDSVKIICLVRKSSDTSQLSIHCQQGILRSIVDVVPVDMCDLGELQAKLPDNVTYIYHCAAKGGDWGNRNDFIESNATATKCLVEFASQLPRLKRFLHVSTVDVYPHLAAKDCHEDVEIIRKSKYHYSETKADAERFVTSSNFRWTIIRPAVVYGPHSYTWGLQEAILINQGKGVLVDNAKYKNGAIYIDDLVEAIVMASRAQRAIHKKYNICNPDSGTWKDFYDAIADGIEKPHVTFSVPYWLAWIVAFIMEFIWRLFNIEHRPLLTFFLLRLVGQDQDWPIHRAQEDFGWVPRTSLDEGVARMMVWLKRTRSYLDDGFLH